MDKYSPALVKLLAALIVYCDFVSPVVASSTSDAGQFPRFAEEMLMSAIRRPTTAWWHSIQATAPNCVVAGMAPPIHYPDRDGVGA
jgi:hypothetical protein